MLGMAGASGAPLDFSASRAKEYSGVPLERKICEGFCGGTPFYRRTPKTAKEGRKLCDSCHSKQAAWMKRKSNTSHGDA